MVPEPAPAAAPALASAFGASVRLADAASLCLLVGEGTSPEPAVVAAEGEVVARLGGHRVLAVLRLSRLPAVRAVGGVRSVGPVSVDPARFAAFAARTRLDAPVS